MYDKNMDPAKPGKEYRTWNRNKIPPAKVPKLREPFKTEQKKKKK
jgi:hypothetical protein